MTVGGDQAHRLRSEHELRTVQEEPGVLARNRKLRFGHHLLQRRARERRRRGPATLRQAREIFFRQRLHPRVEAIGSHFDAALVLRDADIGIRKGLDDLVQFFGRQRERSRFAHRCGTFAAQPDFEIGCEKADLALAGVHQDVRQDGNRVLSFDDSLKKLQFSQQIGLADD